MWRQRLIVAPFAAGKTRELDNLEASLKRDGCAVCHTTAELSTEPYDYIVIDDVDRWSESARARMLAAAADAGVRVVATSRIPLPGFEMVEKRSQSYLPTAHQRLLSLIYGVFSNVRLQTDTSLQLAPMHRPVTDRLARAGALAINGRVDGDALCVGACPPLLKQALLEAHPTLTFLDTLDAYYGRRAATIVAVCFDPLNSNELLELLTRADERLTVVFDCDVPLEPFTRVHDGLRPLMAPSSPWVNWEGFAVDNGTKRKRKRRPHDAVEPKTVSALVAHLGNLCKERQVYSADAALALAAQELDWRTVPKCTVMAASADAIIERSDPAHGLAAELIMMRELAFVEPCTPNIILPGAVGRFRSAVFADNTAFVQAWAAQPGLQRIKQSATAWTELMHDSNKWGHPSASLIADIAAAPTPIVVLPASLKRHHTLVDQAAAAYIDPAAGVLPDWVALALAAVVRVVDQGHHTASFPTPDADKVDLRRIGERARHFWYRTRTRYVQDQVFVRTDDRFKGFCDFALNDDAILELKCSIAEDTSFTAKVLWPLQAAIYAHALRRPNAYVFNVNRNQIVCIKFNPNHLV
jgi:hypothetical protein